MSISQPGPFHSLSWPGRETKGFTCSLWAHSCMADSNSSHKMGCSPLQNHNSASFSDNISSHSAQPSLSLQGWLWALLANSRPSVTLLLKRASCSASEVLGCFGFHGRCCWAFCKYLMIQPLSYRHGDIISQKRDGSKDKEKTWVDLAQSLLLSSFVYNMWKGEKAEEKKGFCVFCGARRSRSFIKG